MQKVWENVEIAIEESYLLGLSETQIREDLNRFVEACAKVIREHVRDKNTLDNFATKLALARSCALVADTSGVGEEALFLADGTPKLPLERIAEKAARNKRLLLKIIGECDPKLVELIDQERFYGGVHPKPILSEDKYLLGNQTKVLLLKICYAIMAIGVFLLIYLTFRVG